MDTIVLATNNKGKIRELSVMLEPFGLQVKSLAEFPEIGDIPETGDTFLENAFIKARAVSKITGLVAVADDSGIEIDALGGRPGVYSARYAGEACDDHANNEKMLAEMQDVPDGKRTGRYRCVMAASAPNGTEINTDGAYEILVGRGYKGKGGFGYDVIVIDPELGCHVAELDSEVKNRRSHRGKAMHKLLAQWPDFWRKVQA
ncbi:MULTISPECIES: RdgB/HAM1 family non-canonical purine NTP pyrophosphatase [unclassified Pseudodesulfovibrio]|uniref:RdgB/HAM1 family non-canonical purine NTP pyrophosphatase n=1 Tax=unclassified Pseudodesulfovibrio TaxID=2661612 RepID=UPI000FEBF153|nr:MULTISPECIES: RdgB/HAM1 family non-canonical purine NTP pyrophosphatase [unclassified Pseudodesulfovibrio]MCJ2165713.1 RdgB/HAM1 family non-canonical purine NTP pyrophosphatase [Pseudodesulfovibrio sp. S3-i]RWU02974.1 RdgB/HAM1 family non-canonical purine NTP pyrophosphatase [Pseudodesulfovibrio sp. S3]